MCTLNIIDSLQPYGEAELQQVKTQLHSPLAIDSTIQAKHKYIQKRKLWNYQMKQMPLEKEPMKHIYGN